MNNYEAEVVEDIPEQFDLSRYKKNRTNPNSHKTSQLPPLPSSHSHQLNHLHHYQPTSNYIYPLLNTYENTANNGMAFVQYPLSGYHSQNFHVPPHLSHVTLPRHNHHYMPSQAPQVYYAKNDQDSYSQENLKKNNATSVRALPEHFEYDDQRHAGREQKSTEGGRKKNSFGDEENENPFQKKEYYLKGGEEALSESKWTASRENSGDLKSTNSELSRSTNKLDLINQQTNLPKSSLKTSNKKTGVTFDEKLEVYEVKNPHYGLEVKSEKREIRKKRKDRQKEEEIAIKTKLEMKSKVQSKNMLHYYVRSPQK